MKPAFDRSVAHLSAGCSPFSDSVPAALRPRVLLLIPTTTYRTQAFMEAARKLDIDLTVASEETSTLAGMNPAGLLTLDFSSLENTVRRAVEFHAEHPIAAVVAVDDQVTEPAAAICEALGLRSHALRATSAARNKFRSRQLLQRAGLPTPRCRLCSVHDDPAKLAAGVAFPCVLKPLALSASRGVIRADDAEQFAAAFQRVARILQSDVEHSEGIGSDECSRTSLLVEDFVPGREVALEGLLTRGRLRVLALFDKPDPLDGPFFEETIYVTPSRLDEAVQAAIVETCQQATRALGLTEGPVHAELRINDAGVWIIEVNPRSIGGLCSHVLRFGAGMSLEEVVIRHALDAEDTPPARESEASGVMMIPIPKAGRLSDVRGLAAAQSVPSIERVTISARWGQVLQPLPEGALYLGFIFARGETPAVVEAALRRSHAELEFDIEPITEETPTHCGLRHTEAVTKQVG